MTYDQRITLLARLMRFRLYKASIGKAMLALGMACLVSKQAWAGPPLPITNNVQRTTPAVCPASVIPVVNSQGTSSAGKSFTTNSKIIPGNPSRYFYQFTFSADTNCMYGSANDVAASPVPTNTVGYLYKANVPYFEDVFAGNRLDCATVSGADVAYTVECNP